MGGVKGVERVFLHEHGKVVITAEDHIQTVIVLKAWTCDGRILTAAWRLSTSSEWNTRLGMADGVWCFVLEVVHWYCGRSMTKTDSEQFSMSARTICFALCTSRYSVYIHQPAKKYGTDVWDKHE